MLRKACWLLLAIVLCAGCAQSRAPSGARMIAEYVPSKDAEVSKTPYPATYVLCEWPVPPSDPPPQEWLPERDTPRLFKRGLGKRQSIGFEKTSDGKLLAVAGEEKIPLESGRYYWQMDPSTEYTGLKWLIHETGERTVELISLPFGLAAVAIAVPFVFGCLLCAAPFMLLS